MTTTDIHARVARKHGCDVRTVALLDAEMRGLITAYVPTNQRLPRRDRPRRKSVGYDIEPMGRSIDVALMDMDLSWVDE